MAGHASARLPPTAFACLGLLVASGCSGHRSAAHAARAARAQVPAGFVAEAFAAVGARDLWVLGSAPCRTGRCTVVVRTRDGGRTFARAGTLPLPTEGTTPSLAFADDRNGFAFVPGFDGVLYATHDGGKSWHRQALGDVLAFAATESTAYAVTARCAPDGCTRYRLVHAPASSSAWSATATPFTPDGGLVALAARGSKLWLLGSLVGIHPKDRLARSGDSGRTFTTASGPCYSDLGGTLTPAPASVVWAVCPTGMLGAAFRSIDGGASFTQLKTEALANSARLAAASGTTAVLFGNGAGSRLMRTTDGGASWKPARTPRIPSDVWSLAFTSSRVGFALVQTGRDAKKKVERQMLWRTTDAGARWSELQIR